MSFVLYNNVCAFALYVHHNVDLLPAEDAETVYGPCLIHSLAGQHGINIQVVPKVSDHFSSYGAPWLSRQVALLTDPSAPRGAQKFFILHELFLLKSQSHLWCWVIPLVCSVSALILTYSLSTLLIADLIGYGVGFVSKSIIHKVTESRADAFAMKRTTFQEQGQASDYLRAQLSSSQKWREESGALAPLKKLVMNREGDYRLNPFSSSLRSRIEKLEVL